MPLLKPVRATTSRNLSTSPADWNASMTREACTRLFTRYRLWLEVLTGTSSVIGFDGRNAGLPALPLSRVAESRDDRTVYCRIHHFAWSADVPHREKLYSSTIPLPQAAPRRSTIGVRTPVRQYDTESPSGRNLSLAGRPRIRQFLCSLPRRQALVLGDLLADRRLLQLDHRPSDAGDDHDQRPTRGTAGNTGFHALLVLLLGPDVGARWPDLRAHHALSRHVARHGDGARLLCRLRHPHAAHLRRRLRRPSARHHLGTGDPDRGRGLFERHRVRRQGGHVQGTRDVGGTEAGDHQGIQPEEGHRSSDFFGRDERLLLLRPARRRPDQGPHPRPRHHHAVAGTARA